MRFVLPLACLAAAATLFGCGGDTAAPTGPTPPPIPMGQTVRMVYAIPPDREFRSDHASAISAAFADLQSWYREQLGGVTFTLHSSMPDICWLPHEADYYLSDTWTRVMTGVQSCVPASYDSPEFRWALYADVEHLCDAPGRIGAASRGVTIMGRGDLDGLSGNHVVGDCGPVTQYPVGRFIGGAGHELGHTFGLPHPEACQTGVGWCDSNCLMWAGYVRYPNTYFREEEKARLRESPFIR